MRKKIEELRNKEEGFTLVELLAVIVILGIIIAIAIPAVGNIMSGAREDSKEAEAGIVVDAARLYFAAEGTETAAAEVSVATLLTQGYLEKEPEYADSGEDAKVIRTAGANGGYTYTYGEYTFGDEEDTSPVG